MVKCIVCDKNQNLIFKYKNYRYYRCQNCLLVSTYPLPKKEDFIKHYKKGFEEGNYNSERIFADEYNSVYVKMADILEDTLKKRGENLKLKKVLDIGCYTGEFLEILNKRGADVYGLELQKDAVMIANKKLPGRVKEVDIMKYNFSREKYDIVSLIGVIEHVTDPNKLIKKCSKILNKNGIIFIQTPNSSSFLEKILGKYWPPYSPIEHIHLFGRKSLSFILKENDFEYELFKNHYKILAIGYVYNIMGVFGPEFKSKLKYFSKILSNSKIKLPFYVGEFIAIAYKK
jgi:2-polyprenyl-3-methyl-5-hydroxy-6-metoxy-1,4-benzoquinol methylase